MANWYTADPHFNHASIIKFCDRPFLSVSQMDQAILRNLQPVFITRDGRQEFVLLSVDYYEQLLARASAPRSGAAMSYPPKIGQ